LNLDRSDTIPKKFFPLKDRRNDIYRCFTVNKKESNVLNKDKVIVVTGGMDC
jgi:hypothetical protein